jgi:hypothetical protein
MSKTYFAEDGNYGNAESMTVVDTDNWTDEDWEVIDESLDSERPWVAELIARKHGAKRWQVWYRDHETGSRMPLDYAPIFQTEAEAEAYLSRPGADWEFPVWVEVADLCNECWDSIGNSVTEEVDGYTRCYSCLTHPVGR